MKKSRILPASFLVISLTSMSPILWAGLDQSSDTSQTAEADEQEAEAEEL